MWRFRSRIIYVSFYLLALHILAGGERHCNPKSIDDSYKCGDNWRCIQSSNSSDDGICKCNRAATLVNGECIITPTESSHADAINIRPDPKPSSGGGSVAAGLLIPTFLMLLGAAAYYGARRYKWIQRFRQFRQNRYGNVLVTRDDTDDDDPPIV